MWYVYSVYFPDLNNCICGFIVFTGSCDFVGGLDTWIFLEKSLPLVFFVLYFLQILNCVQGARVPELICENIQLYNVKNYEQSD